MIPCDPHFKIEVFTDLADERLAEVWRKLQASGKRIDPFSTYWWAQAAREYRTEVQPYVVVAFGAQGPLAMGAFGLVRTRWGQRLTSCDSWHRDLFDVVASDDSVEVVRAICDALPWEAIHQVYLPGIPADSQLGPALHDAARHNGLRGATYVNNGAPELSLLDKHGKRYVNYRGIMRGKTSKQIQRRLARLGKIEYIKASERGEIADLISSLTWLHQKRWYATSSPSPFSNARERRRLLSVAETAFDAGMLHLGILYADRMAVGGALGYVVGKTYYYHIVAHDLDFSSYSPGRTLMSFLLDDLLGEDRANTFSYLSGEEGYKLAHATGLRQLFETRMTRSRSRAAVICLGAAMESWLRCRPRLLSFARLVKHRLIRCRYKMRCRFRMLSAYHHTLGTFGLSGKVFRRLAEYFYERRKLVVIGKYLTSKPCKTSDIEICAGTLDDFNELTRIRFGFLAPDTMGTFFRRLHLGSRYYVLRLEGVPVSSVWIQIGGTYAPSELLSELAVTSDPDRDGFVIDAWTVPRLRGQGIYTKLLQGIIRELYEEKACNRLLAAADAKNMPSIRAHRRVGFEAVEELEVCWLFGRTVRKNRLTPHSRSSC